jgi:hypothetical protein
MLRWTNRERADFAGHASVSACVSGCGSKSNVGYSSSSRVQAEREQMRRLHRSGCSSADLSEACVGCCDRAAPPAELKK